MHEGSFLWVEAKEKLFSQCDALVARWCKCVNPQTCGPVVITLKRATAVKTAVASWLLITLQRRRPSTEAQVLLVNNIGGRARKTAERELENLSRISFSSRAAAFRGLEYWEDLASCSHLRSGFVNTAQMWRGGKKKKEASFSSV